MTKARSCTLYKFTNFPLRHTYTDWVFLVSSRWRISWSVWFPACDRP